MHVEAQRGGGSVAPTHLSTGSRKLWAVNIISAKQTQYPFNRRLGGFRGRSGRKISSPPEFDSRTSQLTIYITRICPLFNGNYKAQKAMVYCPSRYCSHEWGNSHLYCYVLRYFRRIISTEGSIRPQRDSLPLFREKKPLQI